MLGLAEHQVGGCHATLGTTTLLRMKTLALSFLIYYTVVLAVIGIYGLHRYWMVWVFWRSRRRGGGKLNRSDGLNAFLG